MNKKIFLLLLIVLSLISMSAISAADVDDNNQTLALDSSSDVSSISVGNADVLAVSNNNEIQQISDSDDVIGDDDDKDPVIIHIDDSIRDQTIHEDEEFKIKFEIWDASGDEPCPFIIDTDDGFEVELVIGDEVDETTETDDFEGEFTVDDGLGPECGRLY